LGADHQHESKAKAEAEAGVQAKLAEAVQEIAEAKEERKSRHYRLKTRSI
jgi:hypothetical protein